MRPSNPLRIRIPRAACPTFFTVAAIALPLSIAIALPLAMWTSLGSTHVYAQGVDEASDDAGDDDGENAPPKAIVETDSVVLAFRGLDPRTLPQLGRAVQAMYGIHRVDEAKVYLAKIETLNSNKIELANLARELGGRIFIKLRADPEYDPEGREFAELVLSAYGAELNDEARLANLASRRAGGQRGTLQSLVEAGRPAVPFLVAEMAKATDEATEARLVATIVKIGPTAVNPLTASLQSGDDKIISGVAKALGALGDARAAKHLVGPAWDGALDESTRQAALHAMQRLLGKSEISQPEAERFLIKKVLAAYRGDAGRELGEYDDVWMWDEPSAMVRKRFGRREMGSRVLAAKLASDMAKLRPQDGPIQDLAISARLAAAKSMVEPGSPLIIADGTLYAEMQRVDPAQLLRVLKYSLENGRTDAATAACEVLGQTGPNLLGIEGAMAPLVKATYSPNRRLQFAACRAIRDTTDGDAEFTGSSQWISRVGYFISSHGVRKAIVADTVDGRGRTLSGLLNEHGISSVAVKTGNDLIAALVKDPDVEFILMHERLNGPLLSETLQVIRGDYRMSAVPVAILKDGGDDLANDRLAETDPLTISVPLPVTGDYAAIVVGRLLALNTDGIAESAERHRQAEMAIEWIEIQTKEPANRWQLEQLEEQILIAVGNPDLVARGASLLGRLANVGSQRRLLELLNNSSESDEARTAALDAFVMTIQSSGILIGGTEIRQQMRLAKSQREDTFIQEAFASLLKRLTEEKK